jgi:hypothetical protein
MRLTVCIKFQFISGEECFMVALSQEELLQ